MIGPHTSTSVGTSRFRAGSKDSDCHSPRAVPWMTLETPQPHADQLIYDSCVDLGGVLVHAMDCNRGARREPADPAALR